MFTHESNGRVAGRRLGALTLAAALGVGGAAFAADWPQWRGSGVDGIAQQQLDGRSLAVAWSRDVGIGYSAATVAGDRAYIMGWRGGKDTIWCLDAATGNPVWQHSYDIGRYNKMHEGGPAATPAVDDGRVYTLSRDGRLICLDARTGKVLWGKELKREFGVSEPDWSFSGSPVIEDRMLLIDVGKVIAFDKTTGRTLWQTSDYGSAYSTPVAFNHGGKRFLATFPKQGLVILDAATGREIAQHRWRTDYGVNAATPIVREGSDATRIFITSGYNTGCALMAFDGRALSLVWENREIRGQMATPVLIGDHLYGFDESQLKCVEFATGQRVWSERGLGKGAIAAAGNTLVIQAEDGHVLLAAADPAAYREITRIRAFDGNRSWVMPVVANGRVFAKSPTGMLVALDVK
jgi:outer membrane protein assembly factor BamB